MTKIFRPHSLKTRVTLFTLVIFVVSIWSLMFYANRLLRDDIRNLLGEQQRSTVELLAQEINHQLNEHLDVLEHLSATITPAEFKSSEKLQKKIDTHSIFFHFFNEGIFITKTDGVAIASIGTPSSRLGVNYIDRDYILSSLKGQRAIGIPIMGKVVNQAIVGLSVPIKDSQGHIIGVLAGVVNLSRPNFLDNLIQSPHGKTGWYVVVSPLVRKIVTATGKSRILEVLPEQGQNLIIDQFLAGKEGTALFTTARGVKVMASAKKIPVANWSVAAALPTSEAFEPITTMQQKTLYVAIFFTLWATGLTWWILQRQLSPLLSTIKLISAQTHSDELPTIFPVQNKDEFGELIHSFNHLLEKLAQREHALKLSEERFELAVNGAEEGIWDNDLITGEVYHSRQMSNMLGYTPEELPANLEAWQEITHPQDWDSAWIEMNKHLENLLHDYNMVCRFRHKNGSWRWVQARGKATRDSSGFALRVTGTHTDITERIQLEKQLNEARARTIVLIDSIPDLIFYKDPEGIYLGCNEAFAKLVNKSIAEIVGKTDYDLFPKEQADFYRTKDKEVLAAKQRQNIEEWIDYPDGKRGFYHTVKTPFWIGENHNMLGLLGISRDITERYKAEKAIQTAKELAEEATKTKSNFLANMSHEIRTPMNAIIGLSYLALQTQLTVQQRDYLAKIQSASNHLLGIINDVLDFSKIEAGKLTIEHADFSFDSLIENVTTLTAEKARAKGLKLQFSIDKNVPKYLNGDALRLGQILINYVNNALKFTENGCICVSANVENETHNEVILKFSVRDTGIGLTPEVKAGLFQAFQQADASTSRKYGGTGLGLVICKQLALLMNGEVGVESEFGEGSTFWFTAKLGKVKDGEMSAQNEEINYKPLLKTLADAVLLIVEDNEFNQDVMRGLLANCGLELHFAGNGQQALEMLTQQHFDIVFMDMQMPVMDGVSATLEIRHHLKFNDLPIIAMTANALEQDKEKCFAAGMNDYLVKPIYPNDLYRILVKWIKPEN